MNIINEHIKNEVTTLATLWKIVRRDGVVLGFADHDADILYKDVLYKSATGILPSSLAKSETFAVDNMEVKAVLDSDGITEHDLSVGAYDSALIYIMRVNYNDLAQKELYLQKGTLGEVKLSGNKFTAEVCGITQPLQKEVGDVYSKHCRAQFGDCYCKYSLDRTKYEGSVDYVIDDYSVFVDNKMIIRNYDYDNGYLSFVSGQNTGLKIGIRKLERAEGKIMLILPAPYPIVCGDCYKIYAGCNKRFDTCANTYDNVINFRGEPYVPGVGGISDIS